MMKFLTALTIFAITSMARAWETPSQALTEFLNFELNGARISSERWSQLRTYLAMPEDYSEPGWDEATVVKRYRVLGVECASATRCQARIEFDLFPTAGLRTPAVEDHPKGGKKILQYQLVALQGSWRVEAGFGAPVITIQTYRNHKKKYKL